MSLLIVCPNRLCGGSLRIDESGDLAHCPRCGLPLRVSWAPPGKRELAESHPSGDSRTLTLPPAVPAQDAMSAASDSFVAEWSGTLPPVHSNCTPLPWRGLDLAAAKIKAEERLGRFELRGLLGTGAFGKVYEAYDPQLDRCVALKVLPVESASGVDRATRWLREARAAARLQHPGIVPVFDAGQIGSRYYIATAIVRGRALQQFLTDGPLAARRAAEIVQQVADALDYAHRHGVVHRDVKPANVMIDETGRAVLMDFGVALRSDDDRLTRDGGLVGTPHYMAPELTLPGPSAPLPASDQYSLGVVLYELLTGQPLFAGPPELALYHHQQTRPPALPLCRAEIPSELAAICQRCLAKDPSQRYADCRALAQALGAFLDGAPAPSDRCSPATDAGTTDPTEPWLYASHIWQVVIVTTLFATGMAAACLAMR